MNIFVEDTEAKAREFLKTHPVSFPSGYDWQLALAKPLGFRGMPYVVVISPNGEVARRFIGPVTQSDLATEIEKLLATR